MSLKNKIAIIGGGLAGSEASLTLASFGFDVTLFEMRPMQNIEVHYTDNLAELVCSNSLKSIKEDSAAGMLKKELICLNSKVFAIALKNRVDAGGALAVDRQQFSNTVTSEIERHQNITLIREEVSELSDLLNSYDAIVLATGPLTSSSLSATLQELTGKAHMAFFDAAAPIVMADSLNMDKLFRQSRYADKNEVGDYLNAPFTKDEYYEFISELVSAKRVISKNFEKKDLFQACQPAEEIARKGFDALRYGALKPVGLANPLDGKRPWAVLQLRAENVERNSYNLVGFQTNLTFKEQERIFRMVPGLEKAEFARFGVMHRNTYINAPKLLDNTLRLCSPKALALETPIYIAGQLSGTEGYCEAIRSGLHVAISIAAKFNDINIPIPLKDTAFGALLEYAVNPETVNYQPMHVNFGIMRPIDPPIKNKRLRYLAYAKRGEEALNIYVRTLRKNKLLPPYIG